MGTSLVDLKVMGSKKLDAPESQLLVPELPEKTRSYQPVGHKAFLDLVRHRVEKAGFNILQETHSLASKGQRYFGLMQLDHPELDESNDAAYVMGLRNSYDKSIPAGLVVGTSVWMCSNLLFGGEFKVSRKHTTNVWADLPHNIESVIGRLQGWFKGQLERYAKYRGYDLGDLEAHDLIAKLYRSGALSKVQVADSIDQWHSPNHPEFQQRNMYALLNAITENFKGRLDLLPSGSKQVTELLDEVTGFKITLIEEKPEAQDVTPEETSEA